MRLGDGRRREPADAPYYERRGLLDQPHRTLGGHRVYLPTCAGSEQCPIPFTALAGTTT